MTTRNLARTRLLVLLAVASTGCVINLGGDEIAVREEKMFRVQPGAEVVLETFDGSIEVRSWDQSQVRVEIQRRGPDRETASALEVRATQEGNVVRVEAPKPKVAREVIGIGHFSAPSVSLVVQVPQNTKLTATTGDGAITVANVNGAANLKSGDGSIRVDGASGEVIAHTGDGAVTMSKVSGRVSVETGDGSVSLRGRLEALTARTNDGAIDVEADEGSAVKSDWEITTGDGSVRLQLPRGLDAEIDGETGDGGVHSEIEGVRATREENGDRGTIRVRIGAGGRTVRVRTGDGAITLQGR
jgi:DUF4097 and DUF4098 domain-containing protein YvlB